MKIGMSLRGARPRSNLGIMRVSLLPLRFAQGRNDTWGIYFRNKSVVNRSAIMMWFSLPGMPRESEAGSFCFVPSTARLAGRGG